MMPAEMERWRSYFAQAEGDLWTIIHQAILVAAVDFPAEFKYKRCEIAEILFARRPCLSPSARSMEATRLSGSAITNATADAEKGPYETCINDIRHVHASRVEIKLADTRSQGTVSKASAVERHTVHGENSIELDTLENCNASRDHPQAGDLAMDYVILQDVRKIKEQIMDLTNQSEDGLLRSLHVLEHLDINVEILKATDIGREVNKFRKHSSAPVRSLVKQLVRTWKGMVDEWVRNAEAVLPLSASGVQEVFDREVSHMNSQTDVSTQTSMHLSKAFVQQYLNKSIIDSASAVRSHLHCDQAVEEMGSSRVESDELYGPGFMERKADSCQQQVQFSRCFVAKTSSGGFGPGKPVTSIPDTERAFLKETVASEHGKGLEEKSRNYDQRGGSQKSGHGKVMITQNGSLIDHERIETMKRRFPSEDQHIERAKKQREVPPASTALELSKRGVVGPKLPACVKSQLCIQKR